MRKRESGDESNHSLDRKRPHYVVINIGNCDLYNFPYIVKSIDHLTAFLQVLFKREG